MASFCYQCTEELFGEEHADKNDFVGLVRHKERYFGLCDGCGWITMDKNGKRINEDA